MTMMVIHSKFAHMLMTSGNLEECLRNYENEISPNKLATLGDKLKDKFPSKAMKFDSRETFYLNLMRLLPNFV
jgi:hypothetical protein